MSAELGTSTDTRSAHGPHDALRLTLGEVEDRRTTGTLLLLTASGSIAALRLQDGRATHAAYQGIRGDAALRRTADDGVVATRTDAGVELALGPAAVLTVAADEIFSVEPSAEIVERWLFGPGSAPAPERTAGDETPAGPAPLAPGSEVGPGLRIEEMLDRGRHGILYAMAVTAHGTRGRYLEWAPPGATRHHERGIEAEDPREREHYRMLQEAWMAGARGRAEVTDRLLGKVWNVGQWGTTTGMTADAHTGRPITRVRARWSAQRLQLLAIRLASSIVRLHLRGLVHGDLRAETVRVESDGTIRIGGTALPSHSMPGAWRRHGRYDGLEGAVLGEVSERGDLFALATLLIEIGTGRQMPSIERILFEPAAERAAQNALERFETIAGGALVELVREGRNPYPQDDDRVMVPLLRSMLEEYETRAQDTGRPARVGPAGPSGVAPAEATHARTEPAPPVTFDTLAAPPGGADTLAGVEAPWDMQSEPPPPEQETTHKPGGPAITRHVRRVAETLLADAIGATTAARMMRTVSEVTSLDTFVETLASQIPGTLRRPAHEARRYFAEEVNKAGWRVNGVNGVAPTAARARTGPAPPAALGRRRGGAGRVERAVATAAETAPEPEPLAITAHVRRAAETLLADALGATTAARMMGQVSEITSLDVFVETLAKQIPGAVRRPAQEAREHFGAQVYEAARHRTP